MYADLLLYTQPQRPLINPALDLFAFLDTQGGPALFPAKLVDRLQLMLPEKCRQMQTFPDDVWEFIVWQTEERGFALARGIDSDWIYWAVLADRYTLLNMARVLV